MIEKVSVYEQESENEEAAAEDSDEDNDLPAEEAKPTRQSKTKGGKSKVKKPPKQSQSSGSLQNPAGDTHAASTSQSGADEYEYDSSDEEVDLCHICFANAME